MQTERKQVMPHHEPAAELWSLGGAGYERVSFGISDALAHAAQRLGAKPGEHVLDVATGTGWTARNVAAMGARVTAVDIADGLVDAARELAAHLQPPIDFRVADAEALPFDDASFDRVISTFGVMFATNHRATAAELARVCRSGGRLVLATWVPDGSVAEMFGIIGKHGNRPRQEPSPLAWGNPDHVHRLLGDEFELVFEHATSHSYSDSVADIWKIFERGFGPVRQLLETLPPDRVDAFRQELDAYHARYLTEAGLLHVERDYLLTVGRRR